MSENHASMRIKIVRGGRVGERTFEKGQEFDVPKDLDWSWTQALFLNGMAEAAGRA